MRSIWRPFARRSKSCLIASIASGSFLCSTWLELLRSCPSAMPHGPEQARRLQIEVNSSISKRFNCLGVTELELLLGPGLGHCASPYATVDLDLPQCLARCEAGNEMRSTHHFQAPPFKSFERSSSILFHILFISFERLCFCLHSILSPSLTMLYPTSLS